LKLLKDNVGKPFEDTGIGKYFLNRTPICLGIRARLINRIASNLKASVLQRKQLPESVDKHEQEKIFAIHQIRV
jgi:hypothetical protein